MATKAKHNFTEGPMFWQLTTFALPIMLTSLLQLLYNTADKVVVGQFSGDDLALGAIGSTTFVINLIVNFMIGVGGGVGVLVAQLYGSGDKDKTARAVHSAVCMGLVLSSVLMVVGFLTAEPLLVLLETREEFMDNALLYMRITYLGLIAVALYNIGSAVLRAVGDSKTSLYIGMASGLINVILNLIFVTLFHMSVEGVAIATIISQYFSATGVLISLMKRKGEAYRLRLSALRADKQMVLRMLRLGIPTGLQSCCFSFTNMFTTHAVNQFPSSHITARSIALDIDHIVGVFSGAFMHSALTATGQNYGAGKYDRVRKAFAYTLIQSFVMTFILSQTARIFRAELASLFVSVDNALYDEIIAATDEWCGVMLTWYFAQGVLNAVTGSIRGMGYSMVPLIINIIGTCVVRLVWIFFIFPLDAFHTFAGLAMMYPISWAATAIMISVVVVIAFIKLTRGGTKGNGDANDNGEDYTVEDALDDADGTKEEAAVG